MSTPEQPRVHRCRLINLGILAFAAVYFFLYPAAKVLYDLTDPNIRGSGIPRSAWGFHQALAPKYEKWAVLRSGLRLRKASLVTACAKGQMKIWAALIVSAIGLASFGLPLVAAIVLLLAQFFPRSRQQAAERVNDATCTAAFPKSGMDF